MYIITKLKTQKEQGGLWSCVVNFFNKSFCLNLSFESWWFLMNCGSYMRSWAFNHMSKTTNTRTGHSCMFLREWAYWIRSWGSPDIHLPSLILHCSLHVILKSQIAGIIFFIITIIFKKWSQLRLTYESHFPAVIAMAVIIMTLIYLTIYRLK